MNIILKISITLTIALLTVTVQAQKLYTGIGAGAHMTTATYFDTSRNKKATSARPGGRLFFMGKINLEGKISFTPEVSYTMKGFRVKNPQAGIAEQEIILHYFEFMFLQEYSFTDQLYAKIGPSVGGAIIGRDKQLSTSNVRSNKPLAINFGEWGRFEAAVNIGVGLRFGNGFIAEARVAKSINSIYDGDEGPKVKNILFGINVGKYLR